MEVTTPRICVVIHKRKPISELGISMSNGLLYVEKVISSNMCPMCSFSKIAGQFRDGFCSTIKTDPALKPELLSRSLLNFPLILERMVMWTRVMGGCKEMRFSIIDIGRTRES